MLSVKVRFVTQEQIRAMVEVSGGGVSDDLSTPKYAGLTADIAAAIQRKAAARRAEEAEIAADGILAILGHAEDSEAVLVEEIRALRAKERAVKVELDALKKARAYAVSSGNYLPLGKTVGMDLRLPADLKAKADIPSDWKSGDVVVEEAPRQEA